MPLHFYIKKKGDSQMSVETRELNKNSINNVVDYCPTDFNCGGFALQTWDWFTPYAEFSCNPCFYSDNDPLDNGIDFEECDGGQCQGDLALQCTTDFILSCFENIRLIEWEDEAKEDEDIILYRIGGGDFHFILKIAEDVYISKSGPREEVEILDKNDAYDKHWSFSTFYDSEIVKFAKKKTRMSEKIRNAYLPLAFWI